MARRPEPRARTVEQVLRELEKAERSRGLLGVGKPGMGGLLSSVNRNVGTGVAAAPSAMAANLGPRPPILDEIDNRFEGSPGQPVDDKPRGGLLASATGMKPRGGLLSAGGPMTPPPAAQPAPAPAPARERSQLGRAGNFLDDFLFGGAAGNLSAERRQRDEQQAAAAAHREAFAFAQTPQGFDPNRYGARLAELGQAPDMSGIVNLEGVNDGRDVRGFRNRQEERGVVGGVAASLMRTPEAERPAAYTGAQSYLDSQGQGYRLPGMGGLAPAVGAAMGADSFLQQDRDERVFGEEQRQAVAAEQFRDKDLGFRQDESQWERQYREGRAAADDSYRNSRAEAEDAYRSWEQQNSFSRSDIEGQVLRKALEVGAENLSPEEKQVYDRIVTVPANPYTALMGGAPAPMAAPMPNQPPAAGPSPASGDPFPGIPDGAIVEQDGVRYQRRGNQMVEAR